MEQSRYTIEKAAILLKTDAEYLYQLAIENKLRLGVEARGWHGCWYPNPDDDVHPLGLCDIDKKNGIKTYGRGMSNGTFVEIKETYISQFWYIHHSELYKLFTGYDRKPIDIFVFEPQDPKKLAQESPDYFTENGFFWVWEKQKISTLIGLNDLKVANDDLLKLMESKTVISERGNDPKTLSFNQWVIEYNLDIHTITKAQIHDELMSVDPKLWASGFEDWWQDRCPIKKKPGRPKKNSIKLQDP